MFAVISFEYLLRVLTMLFTSSDVSTILYHPLINPIVNPIARLPVRGIPRFVITNSVGALL